MPLGVPTEPPAQLVADIGEPHRIDAVELAEGPELVPPLAAEPREAGDLLAVERRRIERGVGGMGHEALTVALNPLSRMAREGEASCGEGRQSVFRTAFWPALGPAMLLLWARGAFDGGPRPGRGKCPCWCSNLAGRRSPTSNASATSRRT